MRIAQVAPLYESVPPQFYGGLERVVSYLTEELVRQGHDVTLFASGDSQTSARLEAACPRSLRLDESCHDGLAYHVLMLERVFKDAHRFDVVHLHVDHLHFSLSRRQVVPTLTTLHRRLDDPELQPLYREFHDVPVVSVSDAQRVPLPFAAWQGTVYNGLPTNLYAFHERPGTYLAFLGRMCREKRVDRAIEIARRLGMPLRIAARIDRADREYFESRVAPLLHDPLVEYIGEIGNEEKNAFLGNALALLFPIDWPEPFGVVMIESLACGTPVVAYRAGSVPEVIEDGVTGFVVDSLDAGVRAVQRIAAIDRRRCREAFEARFSAPRMATEYLRIYEQLAAGRADGHLASGPVAAR